MDWTRAPAWQRGAGVLLVAAALCWPALLNRQPFLFPDTSTYLKGAATGVQKALRYTSPWIEPKTGAANAGSASAGAASTSTSAAAPDNRATLAAEFESSPEKKGVLAGRSVYYGGFVLAAYEAGSLWAPVFLQALLAVLAVGLVLKASQIDVQTSGRGALALAALLTLGTSLPFFVSMLMPDLLTGTAILLAAMLMAFPVSGWRRAAALAVLAFATLAHTSNVLVLAGMLAGFLVASWFLRAPAGRPLNTFALVLSMVVVGLLGDAAFNAAVKRMTGQAPIRPPFVMARLIADGPGTDWVQTHCARSSYVVCRYKDSAGKGNSDEFLWSPDPAIGVFTVATKEDRAALSAEQFAFAVDVATAYPWRVAATASRNFASQLSKVGLEEFNYNADAVEGLAIKIPVRDTANLRNTLAADSRFPVELMEWVQLVVLATSAGVLGCWLVRHWRDASGAWRMFVSMLLLGLLINALVCGVLSTPHDRYQARVSWLLPLLAFLLIAASRARGTSRVPP